MSSISADIDPAVERLRPILEWLNIFLTPLSILSAGLMLFFCLRSRQISVIIKLISTIAISDILYSLSNAIDFYKYSQGTFICHFKGVVNCFFFVFSVIMASSISVLHYKLSRFDLNFSQGRFFYITLAFGIISSCLFSLSPLVTDLVVVIPADIACYEDYSGSDKLGQNIYYIYSNLPLFVGLAVTIIFYRQSVKRMKKASEMLLSDETNDYSRLFWYPGALFITLMPQMIITFVNYYITQDNIDGLTVTNFIMMRSIGIVNALAYGVQKQIYHRGEESVVSLVSRSSESIKDPLKWSTTTYPVKDDL